MSYGTPYATSWGRPQFDDRDNAIRRERLACLDARPGVRCGDWIVFACGTARRVSHVWSWPGEERSFQTSHEGGGYYLGDGFVCFSGSLYRGVKESTLAFTEEIRDGRVWFFHHDFPGAGCGVESTIPFRVFTSSETAPS